MKKIFLTLISLLMVVGIQAKKAEDITLISGNPGVFYNGIDAYLQIDYTNTTIEGKPLMTYFKEKGDDWVADWEKDKATINTWFEVRFKQKFKKIGPSTVQVTNPDARYRLVVNVDELDLGNTGGGVAAQIFLGGFARTAGGAKIKGTVELFDVEKKERLVKFGITEIQGDFNASVTVRIGMAVYEVAVQLADFVKNNKDVTLPDNEPLPQFLGGPAPAKKAVAKATTAKAATTTAKAATATGKQAATTAKTGSAAAAGTAAKTTKTTSKAATTAAKPAKADEKKVKAESKPAKEEAKPAKQEADDEEEEAPAPKKKAASESRNDRKETRKTEVPEELINAKSTITMGRDDYAGIFSGLQRERHLGIWFDFSKGYIRNNNEEDFVEYMETSARDKDRDPQFGAKWEGVKRQLTNKFISTANDELKDIKLVTALNTPYVIKGEVVEISEKGDLNCRYYLVDMSTGSVIGEIDVEEDGGRIGRFIGLMEQGFEASGEEFGKLLKKAIKKSK